MWPFGKKKSTEIKKAAGEDNWALLQIEEGGKPIVIRMNTVARGADIYPMLPFRLGIAIPLHSPNEAGLPDKPEGQELYAIEDRLDAALGTAGQKVIIITHGGMREFVSYVASVQLAHEFAKQVRAATNTHEVQYYIASDPEWTVFGDYKKLCKTN
ncbi:MAG TPA: DUF695 domain-containing protein [Terriglobia bacterium]|nr:DUF695 domain-containing protein [Terriglobia bacterium]